MKTRPGFVIVLTLAFVATAVFFFRYGTTDDLPDQTSQQPLVPDKNPIASEGEVIVLSAAGILQISTQTLALNDYWVYVNGKLVYKGPTTDYDFSSNPFHVETFDFQLFPMDYSVDVAVSSEYGEFAFDFTSYEVTVTGGQTTELQLRPTLSINLPGPGSLGPGPTAPFVPEGEFPSWYSDLKKGVERKIQGYQSDPVMTALVRIKLEFEISPPLLPIVKLDLPARFGGSREFDSHQIHLIVAWLKRKYWHYFPFTYGRNVPNPENDDREFNWLKAQVEIQRNYIDGFTKIGSQLADAGQPEIPF